MLGAVTDWTAADRLTTRAGCGPESFTADCVASTADGTANPDIMS